MNSLVQYESSSEESDEASNETAPEPELAKGKQQSNYLGVEKRFHYFKDVFVSRSV